jgi:selenide,water dikinase
MKDPAPTLPLTRDLVLIGGGHAHALVLRMWGMTPLPGARVTLISPDPVTAYTGMLPGMVAGHYRREEIMIDLVRLARFAGARLVLGRATGIDRAARRIAVEGQAEIGYDIASIDIGITTDLPDLPGFAAHGLAVKPMADFAARWERFLAEAPAAARVAVLGAGLGGTELALAVAHRLGLAGRAPRVTLIDPAPEPLAGIGARARTALLARCAAAGIRRVLGAEPVGVDAEGVTLAEGARITADLVLSAVSGRPAGWLAGTGLDLEAGFIRVGRDLQSSDPAIFAAGDIAHLVETSRPKAGVFAVRQAPVLRHNLAAALSGGRMRAFRPQRDYLRLVSTGGRSAVADKWGVSVAGPPVWRWKDWIDRAFMARFGRYPAITAPAAPAVAAQGVAEALAGRPLCGGCGAKLGAADLAAALSALPAPRRADVLSGAGDDAAVLRAGPGVQVLTTDHLRAFTPDPWTLARIAAIHAAGDVWAMGARPQAALAQVILPRMAPRMQAETLREIMAAAASVFTDAGADIVGGHSSVGAELTVGFTVTGLADRPVTKGGARPGDALILTKPIGTGTVLAAEMAGARLPGLLMGEAVAAALASMGRPLGPAAAILSPAARAMTDVTGFGLAGHLMEMLEASGAGATLWLPAVPLLPGAAALAAAGHGSSLLPANRAVRARMVLAESPEATLLFDPQTAGGLLAAVPADRAAALLDRLRAEGEAAAIIGEVTAGPPAIAVA